MGPVSFHLAACKASLSAITSVFLYNFTAFSTSGEGWKFLFNSGLGLGYVLRLIT